MFRAAASGFASEDNPVFEQMHEASALIAGGSIVAGEAVHEGRADHAFNPAGGLHHAMREMASGFCVYNDVAVVTAWLRERGHRVAVVDVDVHHGDGTQATFYSDPEVLTISLHQLSRGFFPGTGHPDEIGAGDAAGTSANLPFPPFTWDEPWLRGFDEVVPTLLRRFQPTILVTQCGCDTHLLDPLANLRCSTRIWPVVGRRFHDLAHELCEGRWVALGGGGYAVEEVVPRAWTLLFAEMVGHPELATGLLDPEPFPPVPEAQERIWPAVEHSIGPSRSPSAVRPADPHHDQLEGQRRAEHQADGGDRPGIAVVRDAARREGSRRRRRSGRSPARRSRTGPSRPAPRAARPGPPPAARRRGSAGSRRSGRRRRRGRRRSPPSRRWSQT